MYCTATSRRVNNGDGDGRPTGSFEIKVREDGYSEVHEYENCKIWEEKKFLSRRLTAGVFITINQDCEHVLSEL